MHEAGPLADEDAQLLEHLRARWDQLFRLTTLEQGMVSLGQAPDDARRLRVGDYLLGHPDAHPVVERWGPRTLILTEDEKLLARYLVQRASDGRGEVPMSDAAAALGRTAADVARGLAVLRHVGLVDWHQSDRTIVYGLAPEWRELAGPLAFTFHTVQRESGERFNVP